MTVRGTESSSGEGFRNMFRKKLIDLFLNEYSARRDRGELLYKGRWITPDRKFDFTEELKRDHKQLFFDSLVLLFLGFVGALFLIFLLKLFFFPS
jgi:hypothetical protein